MGLVGTDGSTSLGAAAGSSQQTEDVGAPLGQVPNDPRGSADENPFARWRETGLEQAIRQGDWCSAELSRESAEMFDPS